MILRSPLIFYDIETTGLNIASDRIVSISMNKMMPNRKVISRSYLINPTIPIPKEATAIHGITDKMVAKKPTFEQLSKSLYEFMLGSDLAGFNNNGFDNPILQEEFLRCGIDFPNCEDLRSIDVMYIYKRFNKMNLASAYKHYCGKDLVGAHSSEVDAQATMEIFLAQLQAHEELKGMNISGLHDLCNPRNRSVWRDMIIKHKNSYVFNFGNVSGKKVNENIKYVDWIMKMDFPVHIKNFVTKIKNKALNRT